MDGIVSKIIYNVAMLFVMMVPGVILKKTKMISDGFGKGLSNLVLYIAQPSLVFLAYVRPFDKQMLINSVYVLVFSVIAHAVFAVIALNVFKKCPDAQGRMLKFATIFANGRIIRIAEDYLTSEVIAVMAKFIFNCGKLCVEFICLSRS